MKLIAEMAGEQRTLEVKRAGERVSAQVDERRYELAAREVAPGVYLFNVDGHVYECRVEHTSGTQRLTSEVHVGNQVYEVKLINPKRLRGVGNADVNASGRVELKASMPGKVVRVLVEPGIQVKAGDGLVVVEAMKMQNEMKSPKDGTIVAIHTAAGATVNAGDVLVIVE